mgnify:CR=1 FL=1
MAITFQPKDIENNPLGSTLVIGGQSTGEGLIGPFPKYSISRENVYLSDGTYAHTKFTINVSGTALIRSADPQDITEPGQRQNSIQGETLNILKFARGSLKGDLEIVPYEGGTNVIKFIDAKITSVEAPEQTDETAGIQNLSYSFTFESYQEESVSSNSEKTTEITDEEDIGYWVSDCKDSWEFQTNTDSYTVTNGATGPNSWNSIVNKTYTITRSLSATGINNPILNEPAILSAKKWVELKILSTPGGVLPVNLKAFTDSFDIQPDDGKKFEVNPTDNFADTSLHVDFNHVRSVSSDILSGTYSITDTWILYKGSKATFDISVSVESSIDSPSTTVNVNMTVTGIDTTNYNDVTSNKYANALESFTSLKNSAFYIANAAYDDAGFVDAGGILKTTKLNESTGTNETAGTITYSCSFNDLVTTVPGAINENIQINDDNADGLNQVIAKIDVIGKLDGPVIQDMGTTTIRSRSLTIDLTMDRNHRTTPPSSAALSLANEYKPTVLSKENPPRDIVYRQSKSEQWSPKTGVYNLSINWEYIIPGSVGTGATSPRGF